MMERYSVRLVAIVPNIRINAINKSKMEKKKSSIDWLFIRLFELFDQYERGKISRWTLGELMVTKTEQAKAMHKEEIIEAWLDGEWWDSEKDGEQYYNETFGGQDNE